MLGEDEREVSKFSKSDFLVRMKKKNAIFVLITRLKQIHWVKWEMGNRESNVFLFKILK